MNAKELKKQFLGKWRITWMDQFSRKDLDMETPAYIRIDKGGSGEFQFLLVCGSMRGDFKESGRVFDFTWVGSDECDEASGDGWMRLLSGTSAEGEIRFHHGDTYKFRAVKAKEKKAGRKRKRGAEHMRLHCGL